MASSASQTISTVVFGIIATIISVFTVWQSYKAWKIWHDHHRQAETNLEPGNAVAVILSENSVLILSDLELGTLGNDLQASAAQRAELQPAAPVLAPVDVPTSASTSTSSDHNGVEEESIVGAANPDPAFSRHFITSNHG